MRISDWSSDVCSSDLLKVAAGKIVDKAKTAKDRIAGNVGNAGDNAATGQSTQRGMEAWERRTEGRGGQLFDAIPIDPGTSVDLTAAKQTLSEINGALSSNPHLASLVRDPRSDGRRLGKVCGSSF